MATAPGTQDKTPRITDEEIEDLVEFLFAHRKNSLTEFMAAHSLRKSGTKAQLRDALLRAVTDEKVSAIDLIKLLDTIEGWGNQHIYLFTANAGTNKEWKSRAKVESILATAGFDNLLDQQRPLVLPKTPQLSTIEWTPARIRFVWVERRQWQDRRSDKDYRRNGIVYKGFEDRLARGITTFDWNLTSGNAALMIQHLKTGDNYRKLREQHENELDAAIGMKNFHEVSVRKSIQKLEQSGEVRNRDVEHQTQKGSRAKFTSRNRSTDALSDPAIKKSRSGLGSNISSIQGNFYWEPKLPHLDRSFRVKVYGGDERIGIFGECVEGEVQYVLSRIRHHSK